MIKFTCSACTATITVDDQHAGKRGPCPKCKASNRVPQPVHAMTVFDDEPSSRAVKPVGYTKKALVEGEEVAYKGTMTYYILAGPLLVILLAALFLFSNRKDEVSITIGTVLSVVGCLLMLRTILQIATTEYTITSKRLIYKTGIIGNQTLELVLDKIDSISVEQTVLGRILGYGTLTVSVATERSRLEKVNKPVEFKKQILLQQEE